jgi:2-dehydropantoate 2-reductase
VESTLRTAAGFPPETRTSYQRDIEGRAPADEGDLYGGTILRLGAVHGVPTPVSAELAASIARLKA